MSGLLPSIRFSRLIHVRHASEFQSLLGRAISHCRNRQSGFCLPLYLLHLGCFHLLATVNTINTRVQEFLSLFQLSQVCLKEWTSAGLRGNCSPHPHQHLLSPCLSSPHSPSPTPQPLVLFLTHRIRGGNGKALPGLRCCLSC